jgi:hypothetical protein
MHARGNRDSLVYWLERDCCITCSSGMLLKDMNISAEDCARANTDDKLVKWGIRFSALNDQNMALGIANGQATICCDCRLGCILLRSKL